MATDYKTLHDQVTTAVKDHLMNVDALPPTTELAKLAREITQVVFIELNRSGLTENAFNRLGKTATPQARAQARA